MLKKLKPHSSSGFALLPILIIVFSVVVLVLVIKGAQQAQTTKSDASSFAINCSATCNDGRTYSDSCPGNTGYGGTFPSCSTWANEACGSNGVHSYGGSTGGSCPGSGSGGGGGGGTTTSSICSSYYPTASACRNVAVNHLCNGYSSRYFCKKSGTTNSNDNKPNCGCVLSSTPAPTPTHASAPTPVPTPGTQTSCSMSTGTSCSSAISGQFNASSKCIGHKVGDLIADSNNFTYKCFAYYCGSNGLPICGETIIHYSCTNTTIPCASHVTNEKCQPGGSTIVSGYACKPSAPYTNTSCTCVAL